MDLSDALSSPGQLAELPPTPGPKRNSYVCGMSVRVEEISLMPGITRKAHD